MTQKRFGIAALYGMHEVAWKTDPDADGSDYKHIKTTEMTLQVTADVIERPGLTNDLARQAHVLGGLGGKLTFKTEVKGSGTPAASLTVAIASESSPLLEALFGAVTRGTGTLVTGVDSTTSEIHVVSSASISVGMLVAISGQLRFVTVKADGTHITLDHALSGAPAADVVVYASSMFNRANTGHKSMAFVAVRDGIQYTLLGCKLAAKLEGITAKGTALFSWDVDVGTWTVTTKANLPTTELAGVTLVKAPVVKGAPCSISGTEEVVHGLDLDFGHEFQFIASTSDTDGKAGLELVNSRPAGNLKPYYAAGHMTDFAAGTNKSVAFACGVAAAVANGFGFYAPAVQWGSPALENVNSGLVGETIPFFVNDNGAVGAELYFCVF